MTTPIRPIPPELVCGGCGGGIQPDREGAEVCGTCEWTAEVLSVSGRTNRDVGEE